MTAKCKDHAIRKRKNRSARSLYLSYIFTGTFTALTYRSLFSGKIYCFRLKFPRVLQPFKRICFSKAKSVLFHNLGPENLDIKTRTWNVKTQALMLREREHKYIMSFRKLKCKHTPTNVKKSIMEIIIMCFIKPISNSFMYQ